ADRFFIKKPVTPRMPRCECVAASAAAPSCPVNRASRMSPLPDGSVFGTHMPNDGVPCASGVAKRYREYMNSSVAICPSVRHASAPGSLGFGSTLFAQRLDDQGWRLRAPCDTSKIARQAM